MTRRPQVTIIGNKAGGSRWSAEVARMAYTAGELAAAMGFTVITGGRSGVMEEAARGAKAAGGTVVGILPIDTFEGANPYLDIVIPTNLGIGRNVITALACDCVVALPGGQGTNQELSFALSYRRPVFSWDSWWYGHPDTRNVEFVYNTNRQDKKPLAAFLVRQYDLAVHRIATNAPRATFTPQDA